MASKWFIYVSGISNELKVLDQCMKSDTNSIISDKNPFERTKGLLIVQIMFLLERYKSWVRDNNQLLSIIETSTSSSKSFSNRCQNNKSSSQKATAPPLSSHTSTQTHLSFLSLPLRSVLSNMDPPRQVQRRLRIHFRSPTHSHQPYLHSTWNHYRRRRSPSCCQGCHAFGSVWTPPLFRSSSTNTSISGTMGP